MIIIHAGFQLQADQEQAFLKEIAPLIQASRQEAGNISYQLFKSVDQELAYTMVEVWKDQAAVASHNASEHFTAFTAKAGQFLAAPLDIKAFNGEPLQG
ncbi:antibiotic biosynthesis monooxygenase [Paenibacillus sp. CAA11]|uniref:putative quinol monooxygenase n=1 Tax=Paenibacillus sp. CAA11 TaxID=1532905 RepID=UPI000D3D9DB9|nr:putative quinol monooxygenase [Paenibacillus sp. CAA11]AWB43735.1 antibiotic biosynthesis monooxygenase [Paenibacillus sp. CAA11]